MRERWLLARDPQEGELESGRFFVQIELRADAVWSDGRPISGDDLRFTWQTILDRRWPVATRDGYDRITEVRVVDPKHVTLFFDRPYARWRDLFSGGLGVLPKHALQATRFDRALATAWPVSGGPFVLKSWRRGLEIVLERTPNPWGDEAYLDRIRIQFVPDVVTAFQLLRARKVDALGPYAAIDLQRRGKLVPGSSVTSDIGSAWTGLLFNVRTPEISDVHVRRALALSLDRAAIAEGLVREEGRKLDGLAAPSDAEPAAFRQFRPNLEAADRLLDAAGWSGGSGGRSKGGRDLSVTVATAGAEELPERVLRALHAQADRSGFDLNVVSLDPDRFWRDWLRGSRFEAAFVTFRDAPGGNLRDRFGTASPGNLSKLSDATLDTLLEQADAQWPAQAAPFEQVERRLAQLVPAIPLYRVRVTLVAGPVAHGLRATASADGFLWNAADWSRA